MKAITIIYYSKNGATHSLAEAFAEGAKQLDCQSRLYRVDPTCIIEGRFVDNELWPLLAQSDAIVFGAPTYMGCAPAQFKAFMDASSDAYVNQDWNGKLAAGFTCGGSLNGEQQQTLFSFFALACQHGMLWAGVDTSAHTDSRNLNRLGSSIGLVSTLTNGSADTVHPTDLDTAHYYGNRIARLLSSEKL